MTVESAADRATFFNPAEFGTAASYIAAGRPAVAIAGIFDDVPATAFMAGDVAGVGGNVPTFHCRSADLPSDARGGEHSGDRLVLTDVEGRLRTFRVNYISRDGTGLALLTLEKVDL